MNALSSPDSLGPLLLVEDSEADAMILQDLLNEAGVPVPIEWVSDGNEALRFLKREGSHGAKARPSLILMDLGLPGMTGHELLSTIRTDSDLSAIPIVVFSGSSNYEDISRAYSFNGVSFMKKPDDLAEFERVVADLVRFHLPSPEAPLPEVSPP